MTWDGVAHLKVLVVDDEAVITDTLVLILQRENLAAFAAYSAEHAVELAEEIRPDVLISDVVMGSMNGVELALHFASHFPMCRVLLISGHGSASELMSSVGRQGLAFPILAKPFPPQELLKFIAAGTGQPDGNARVC